MPSRIAIAALLAALSPAPAFCAAGHGASTTISRQQALELARKQGMATIYEMELEQGRWALDGNAADGRHIELDLDARTGEIIQIKRH
ncbi:PepSY domain-containing protein [Hansschlegelia sp. KR7-227]|uniref:PepSY domain-containing protein n=1 Tax=Hansschlegelia sp. KR7-227 TaxID=3400914 RepID=UPI003C034A07